eukprot:COSAG06_NODE_10668_length_1639_cov_9.226122_1_plen_79_part_10
MRTWSDRVLDTPALQSLRANACDDGDTVDLVSSPAPEPLIGIEPELEPAAELAAAAEAGDPDADGDEQPADDEVEQESE